MRRLVPFLIVAVGLLALAVDLVPTFPRPFGGAPQYAETRLGLDLQGGLQGEYQAITEDGSAPTTEQMETIRGIIESRVNATGVAEPIVQTVGSDRVVVDLPGASEQQEIRQLIGATGRLDFVPLPPEVYGTGTSPGTQPVPGPGEAIDPTLAPLFGGEQIDPSGVAPGVDPNTGERVVQFKLRSDGAQLFRDYSTEHVDEFFAIVLDGKVVSAPVIQQPITDGNGQISGSFTTSEQQNLVTTLKYGALPLALRELSFNSISATLGAEFLQASILAGIIGIGLVFLFMLIHYRLPGAVACLALIYYAIVVLAIFRLIPVTLTLAGLAGFILSVGMAVDANILIFERTKEELRSGKAINSAVEAGFNRAWNSILDSNVSSCITAAILFFFGSAAIRGFALVLVVGVLVSMFTAITVSRTILRWVVRQPWARRASLYGVGEDEFVTVGPRGRTREAGARV
ncbi:MAG TPA: protein translocase subunit SecD [Candidatus Limnocylindrales bacterium]|jgi:preprotein translocase subunit SecD